jgi:hypothetical protein
MNSDGGGPLPGQGGADQGLDGAAVDHVTARI